jgi:WD repeat-containing protein 35
MKTAMRLIEYEKELQTKDVYSLVAIASFFNQCYRECSRALVKLERLESLTKTEREAYEMLAINLFFRHQPHDQKQKQEFNCPKCDNVITEFDINCKKCGAHYSPCIASGMSIREKEYYMCRTCKHKALHKELTYLKLKHCPLCHAKMIFDENNNLPIGAIDKKK